MIHRCKTCPFWSEEDGPEQPNIRRCKAEDSDRRMNAEVWDGRDGTWHFAHLYTRSDFGCVIHPLNKAIL